MRNNVVRTHHYLRVRYTSVDFDMSSQALF